MGYLSSLDIYAWDRGEEGHTIRMWQFLLQPCRWNIGKGSLEIVKGQNEDSHPSLSRSEVLLHLLHTQLPGYIKGQIIGRASPCIYKTMHTAENSVSSDLLWHAYISLKLKEIVIGLTDSTVLRMWCSHPSAI